MPYEKDAYLRRKEGDGTEEGKGKEGKAREGNCLQREPVTNYKCGGAKLNQPGKFWQCVKSRLLQI